MTSPVRFQWIRLHNGKEHHCRTFDEEHGPVRQHNLLRVRDIIRSVSESTGFSIDQLVGLSRRKPLTAARHAVMYRARCEDARRRQIGAPRLSTPHIGRILNRDHSTVIHGAERHAIANGLPMPWLEASE